MNNGEAAATTANVPLPPPLYRAGADSIAPTFQPLFSAEQMQAMYEAGRASSAPAQGMVLVPREPTNEMYLAACAAYTDWHNRCLYPESYEEPLTKTSWTHIDVYLSMIAACPGAASVAGKEPSGSSSLDQLP